MGDGTTRPPPGEPRVPNTINQHLDDLVGRMALNRGLVSPEDLMEALSVQAVAMVSPDGSPKPHRPLSDILVEKGLLTENQLASLLKEIDARLAAPLPGGGLGTGALGSALSAASQTRLGKYTLLRELGRGGMGCVFEAYDTELNRGVALKLMYAKPHLEPAEVTPEEERFLREAQLTAMVPKHPAIVSIYEAGVLEGHRYLAMEYIEGVSMLEWCQQLEITLHQKIGILREVALAVHHAHEHGVIHRDLKPQNVLVTKDGRPFVTDFGLAKAVGPSKKVSLTASGMTVGTPTYMSPEQAQGLKTIDRRTDVYSLGVMLYEILAGRPPFAGETAIEILMKAVKHHLPRPSSVLEAVREPALDESIENICLKAMARFPKERYPTAKTFADDLGLWLDGKEVKVRPPKPSPLAEEKRSYRWIFAAVAALALGLVIPPALPLIIPPKAPEGALAQAEEHLHAERFREALVAYAQILAVDPRNVRAETGRRLALTRLETLEQREREEALTARREAEAARQAADAARRELRERETRLAADAETSRRSAEKARLEAVAATRAEIEALRQAEAREDAVQLAERERLSADRAAAEARALAAEQKARLTQEQLARLQAEIRKPTLLLPGPAPLKAAPVDPATLQPGLVAECFSGTDFDTFALRRVDPQISFRWLKQPAWPGGPEDRFSIRWTGFLRAPKTGRYQFEALSDDGIRLFIGDAVVLSDWTAFYRHKTSGGCNLEAGLHRIRVEYFEFTADALVSLSWVPDNNWEAVPIGPEFFFHDPAALAPPPK
jgi:serine/threonine protein kinase